MAAAPDQSDPRKVPAESGALEVNKGSRNNIKQIPAFPVVIMVLILRALLAASLVN